MSVHYCLSVDDDRLTANLARLESLTLPDRLALEEYLGLKQYSLQQIPSLAWLPSLQEEWLQDEWINSPKSWLRLAPGDWFCKLKELPVAFKKDGDPRHFVTAQLTFSDAKQARDYHDVLKKRHHDKRFRFGSDPKISDVDVWSPLGPGGGIFGDRTLAEDLTGVSALQKAGATGRGVNVVIVDRGLDRNWVQSTTARMSSWRGLEKKRDDHVYGWTRIEWAGANNVGQPRFIHPGATGSEHAHMVARNVLAIAPEATIWDAPLLPIEGEEDAPPRPSVASALFYWIKESVRAKKMLTFDSRSEQAIIALTEGPWVIVNAWGVLDSGSDAALDDYADDPDHFLVNDMEQLDDKDVLIDVVFAAGNCGEPCPDLRCGSQDCGPGRSILGLNAHPKVLTVGAVRVDGMPVAFSAQGPGRLAKRGSRSVNDYSNVSDAIRKPDLCAPSHFRESDDGAELNTGTSAACGFAAGILAALRSVPQSRSWRPHELRELLRTTARKHSAAQEDWDPRLGFGVINAEGALQSLKLNAGGHLCPRELETVV